ncbi:MAG: ATP phosphoribosyltransferase regulatory subunit [Pseudomonadota bacterium]|nr:ATP phosphoribosyltransferase regulatory subunit [Pseudomonadota bacterium]
MKTPQNMALLPAGLRDILPPEAAFEAGIREALAATFVSNGYDRVKPPLVEFEEGLTSGPGAAVSGDTFRLMDPVSQRMMGIRADMTTQVARIALTRLGGAPRPLRLSYTGEVLRVRGTQLRPERQFAQVGAELIGSESSAADIEIIVIALESLREIGVPELSVDLTIPPLVPSLIADMDLSGPQIVELRDALDRKDMGAVQENGGASASALCQLMESTGPAVRALRTLDGLLLPPAPASELSRLKAVVKGLGDRIPDLNITVDPIENRGFEYHTGIGFTFFSQGERGEIGSGGRYLASTTGSTSGQENSEPATGFTLYVDTVLRVLSAPEPAPRLFVPLDTPVEGLGELRRVGWLTIGAVDVTDDVASEARRLHCTHVWKDGAPVPLDGDQSS